jgi:DNA-directed RNA polymerase
VKEFSQILAVHDCFGTHANKINLLVETLQNTLISIFEKDVLFTFYAELTKTNSAISGSNTFQKGDFLIGQLKGGEYIFV